MRFVNSVEIRDEHGRGIFFESVSSKRFDRKFINTQVTTGSNFEPWILQVIPGPDKANEFEQAKPTFWNGGLSFQNNDQGLPRLDVGERNDFAEMPFSGDSAISFCKKTNTPRLPGNNSACLSI